MRRDDPGAEPRPARRTGEVPAFTDAVIRKADRDLHARRVTAIDEALRDAGHVIDPIVLSAALRRAESIK